MVFPGTQPTDIAAAVEPHAVTHQIGGTDPIASGQLGEMKMFYGVLADLLTRNPGWKLADGTVTLPDGTTPPNMRDRVPIGAGTTYALGATGGSATQANHTDHAHNQQGTVTEALTGAGATVYALGATTQVNSPSLSHGTNLPPYAALYFLIYVGTS